MWNIIKKIKGFFYKLKEDRRSLFKYPVVDLASHQVVDYDQYWQNRRGQIYESSLSDWQKERADYVLKFFKPGQTIVDLGGGDGEVLKYLKTKVDINGICLDFNDTVLAAAQKNGLAIKKIDLNNKNDWQAIPNSDYIIGFEILEHLANPEELIIFLQERVKIAMIFSVPNSGYYLHRWRLLAGRFPLQWVHHPGEHLRFWTITDMKWWVKSLGLNMIDLHLYQGLPGLKRVWPSLFGQGMIVVLSRK